MITLYTFGPNFGLPDASPFVTKAEMLLKLAGLEYKTDTTGFRRAPKGKLPYIDDEGTVVADSTFIRWHLEKKYGVDFDKGLSPADRGIAWAVEKMLEDHLYWAILHSRWMNDANFDKGPARFFDTIPAVIRPVIKRMIRRQMGKNLHAHGLGRHSEPEIVALASRAIESAAAVLGDRPYLMGAQPCGADATLFAFSMGVLCPHFDTPIRSVAESKPNLVAYVERMRKTYYGQPAETRKVA